MDFIMQMRPLFGKEEKRAIAEYMDEDGFITEYKRTERFESMIAEFTGAKHCIVVNNGTISLTLSALASGIEQGDEVIVPNYTMVATPNSVKMFGASPIFVDVESDTLCLNIDLVRQAITSKTKAIMLVAANGRYPQSGIESFELLAKQKGLILLEDAAQGLGSYYPDGRHIGRAGLIGSFSFSAPKIISTGQGGALITDCDNTAAKLRRLKDFGRSGGGNDIHESIGFNFKFTELQACIGIEQMKKLDDRIIRKKEIYEFYKALLKDVKEIKLFENDCINTAPWFIDCVVSDREGLQKHLKENNIGTRIMYPPVNKQKAYNKSEFHKVSEFIGTSGLWLPSAVQLSDEQIEYICSKIRSFYEK
tara:strand:- start:13315 stop:14406 length:1092 start_codon:yes stop_codon:yes gene_type:complete